VIVIKDLSNEELMNVEGGGFSLGLGIAIGGLLIFAAGLIDGWVRPLKCN